MLRAAPTDTAVPSGAEFVSVRQAQKNADAEAHYKYVVKHNSDQLLELYWRGRHVVVSESLLAAGHVQRVFEAQTRVVDVHLCRMTYSGPFGEAPATSELLCVAEDSHLNFLSDEGDTYGLPLPYQIRRLQPCGDGLLVLTAARRPWQTYEAGRDLEISPHALPTVLGTPVQPPRPLRRRSSGGGRSGDLQPPPVESPKQSLGTPSDGTSADEGTRPTACDILFLRSPQGKPEVVSLDVSMIEEISGPPQAETNSQRPTQLQTGAAQDADGVSFPTVLDVLDSVHHGDAEIFLLHVAMDQSHSILCLATLDIQQIEPSMTMQRSDMQPARAHTDAAGNNLHSQYRASFVVVEKLPCDTSSFKSIDKAFFTTQIDGGLNLAVVDRTKGAIRVFSSSRDHVAQRPGLGLKQVAVLFGVDCHSGSVLQQLSETSSGCTSSQRLPSQLLIVLARTGDLQVYGGPANMSSVVIERCGHDQDGDCDSSEDSDDDDDDDRKMQLFPPSLARIKAVHGPFVLLTTAEEEQAVCVKIEVPRGLATLAAPLRIASSLMLTAQGDGTDQAKYAKIPSGYGDTSKRPLSHSIITLHRSLLPLLATGVDPWDALVVALCDCFNEILGSPESDTATTDAQDPVAASDSSDDEQKSSSTSPSFLENAASDPFSRPCITGHHCFDDDLVARMAGYDSEDKAKTKSPMLHRHLRVNQAWANDPACKLLLKTIIATYSECALDEDFCAYLPRLARTALEVFAKLQLPRHIVWLCRRHPSLTTRAVSVLRSLKPSKYFALATVDNNVFDVDDWMLSNARSLHAQDCKESESRSLALPLPLSPETTRLQLAQILFSQVGEKEDTAEAFASEGTSQDVGQQQWLRLCHRLEQLAALGLDQHQLMASHLALKLGVEDMRLQCRAWLRRTAADRSGVATILSEAAYKLVDRDDLAKTANLGTMSKAHPERWRYFYACRDPSRPELSPHGDPAEIDGENDAGDAGAETAGTEPGELDPTVGAVSAVSKLRFGTDLRLAEVHRLLSAGGRVPIHVEQTAGMSDHDLLHEQKLQLETLAQRTAALAVGRAAFDVRTVRPRITQQLQFSPLNLTGRVVGSDTTITLDGNMVSAEYLQWPNFHNGVSTGLQLTGPEARRTATSWIVNHYALPAAGSREAASSDRNAMTDERAGLLLGLGLHGYLQEMSKLQCYDYLSQGHEATTVALLLGMSAAQRGSLDTSLARMIGIHMPGMRPANSVEVEVTQSMQTAALMAAGLLYQGTLHRRIVEVLLAEIDSPAVPTQSGALNRESHSLAAGIALGMVTLGRGALAPGISDLGLEARLKRLIDGGRQTQKRRLAGAHPRVWEGRDVNTFVTAPGACLALSLMHIKSNNTAVANLIDIPGTAYLLEKGRPHILTVRVLARSLIMWDSVKPTTEWVASVIPSLVQKYALGKTAEDDEQEDEELLRQAYTSIASGACLSIGFRFASSADEQALSTLFHFAELFAGAPAGAAEAGRQAMETALCTVVLAMGMVMAGTGDVRPLRLMRQLWNRSSSDVSYGSHMVNAMSMGLLFLGRGQCVLETDNASLAAMVAAFYPVFPLNPQDNQYHLQAFRHLFSLAVRPRTLIPVDVESDLPVYCPVELQFAPSEDGTASPSSGQKQPIIVHTVAPCIVPTLGRLQRVCVLGQRHMPSTLYLDPGTAHEAAVDGCGVFFVRRNEGHIPYQASDAFLAKLSAASHRAIGFLSVGSDSSPGDKQQLGFDDMQEELEVGGRSHLQANLRHFQSHEDILACAAAAGQFLAECLRGSVNWPLWRSKAEHLEHLSRACRVVMFVCQGKNLVADTLYHSTRAKVNGILRSLIEPQAGASQQAAVLRAVCSSLFELPTPRSQDQDESPEQELIQGLQVALSQMSSHPETGMLLDLLGVTRCSSAAMRTRIALQQYGAPLAMALPLLSAHTKGILSPSSVVVVARMFDVLSQLE